MTREEIGTLIIVVCFMGSLICMSIFVLGSMIKSDKEYFRLKKSIENSKKELEERKKEQENRYAKRPGV